MAGRARCRTAGPTSCRCADPWPTGIEFDGRSLPGKSGANLTLYLALEGMDQPGAEVRQAD